MKYILTGATIAAMGFIKSSQCCGAKRPQRCVDRCRRLRPDRARLLGSKFYETPKSDQLAHDGIKFTGNYSSCTVCSPTRAALLTGKYPARLHITDWTPGKMPDLENARPLVGRTSALCNTEVCKRLGSH